MRREERLDALAALFLEAHERCLEEGCVRCASRPPRTEEPAGPPLGRAARRVLGPPRFTEEELRRRPKYRGGRRTPRDTD